MIGELWKLNVSTILILPLFNHVTKNLKYKKHNISFIQLCFKYGLQKAFLNKNNKELLLVFDKKISSDKLLDTSHKDWSMNEFILTIPEYIKFEIHNDFIIFYFDIDKKYHDDIELISQSKYSKVSEEYKKQIDFLTYFENLVKTDNISDFICRKNIPRSIVYKEKYMRELMESYLDVKIPNENEYFLTFKNVNEYFNIVNLH